VGDKDIVSKDILKRIAEDIARVLLHLKVGRAEIIETEYQTIEDRRADLVAHMWGESNAGGEGDEFILHVEIQNDNDSSMPWRMLRYRAEIGQRHARIDTRQYIIYIGKAALAMPAGIQQTGLDYHYRIVDMHTVDCQTLLTQDNPDALVLAILCDFKGQPAREVVHFIIQRLQQLTADNESRFREYLRMLEILSTNRDLEKTIEEEEKMLSQVKYSQLPSYNIGLEQGLIEGKLEGQAGMLYRQLTRRFGVLSEDTQARLSHATLEQLEQWADNILDAVTQEDVFKHN
jgi:hypothetical protein